MCYFLKVLIPISDVIGLCNGGKDRGGNPGSVPDPVVPVGTDGGLGSYGGGGVVTKRGMAYVIQRSGQVSKNG